MKLNVGITGQSGFIGSHLFNFLGLQNNIKLIPFKDEFFDNSKTMTTFVSKCDVIVHLSAVNRHSDEKILYETNIELVNKLIRACEKTDSRPHILFASSTQESQDNSYGKSKYNGRLLLEAWANRQDAQFTGLVIPNVYGPFGLPYHNSVVATFCHQLSHDETPEIHADGTLDLIYVNELVETISQIISDTNAEEGRKKRVSSYEISSTSTVSVSEILNFLLTYKKTYFDKGIMPDLTDKFQMNLFNTFRCYLPDSHFPVHYTKHEDNRGEFVELIRAETSGQSSYSSTRPGITRGNHFHIRKAERFGVFKGRALIQLRRIGSQKIINYELDGTNPSYVDIPVWHTHNIINIGDEDLYTFFWINEPYNPDDPDTFPLDVTPIFD